VLKDGEVFTDEGKEHITRRCTRTAIPLRSIAAGELGRWAIKQRSP